MDIGNDLARAYQEGYDTAKADVAREIFAEIEGIIAEQFRKLDFKNNQFDDISKDAISLFIGIVSDNLAELKKKYRERE